MRLTHVRVITICIIRKSDPIIVFEGYDHVHDKFLSRPLAPGLALVNTVLMRS